MGDRRLAPDWRSTVLEEVYLKTVYLGDDIARVAIIDGVDALKDQGRVEIEDRTHFVIELLEYDSSTPRAIRHVTQMVALVLSQRTQKLPFAAALGDRLHDAEGGLWKRIVQNRMGNLSGHCMTDEGYLSCKFTIDVPFDTFWMPKAAAAGKGVVTGGVEQDYVIHPKGEAAGLMLKNEALDAKGVQSFAPPIERVEVKQSILRADSIADMEMGIDGISGPLHDDLMQPQTYANFVEPIQEDESLKRGYRLSIQQCEYNWLHGCFKRAVL